LCRKLGLVDASDSNLAVVSELLDLMAVEHSDFTLTFRKLCELRRGDREGDEAVARLFGTKDAFDAWALAWRERLDSEGREDEVRAREMRATNPAFIPRNHQVQRAIDAALSGDLAPLDELCKVTTRPFDDHPGCERYALGPRPEEVVHETFCGT
jgi:uncharacterized protein YdiU (UPF0061 family)